MKPISRIGGEGTSNKTRYQSDLAEELTKMFRDDMLSHIDGKILNAINQQQDDEVPACSSFQVTFSDNSKPFESEYVDIVPADGFTETDWNANNEYEIRTDGTWIADQTYTNDNKIIIDQSQLYYQPAPVVYPTTYTSSSINVGYNSNEKYAVMELPRKDCPTAVFVCGRMLTLGILGTDVECAYTGDKLVFEPGAVSAMSFGSRITLSIEYHDEIYHYNVGSNGFVEYVSDKSSTLKVTRVSTIKKKEGDSITGAK